MTSLFDLEKQVLAQRKKRPVAAETKIKTPPAQSYGLGLWELEREIRAGKKRHSGITALKQKPPSTAYALSVPVDYRVPGAVAALRQPSSMTCWATVAAMMLSWRHNASMPIETALSRIGDEYADKFRRNEGLTGAEKAVFLAKAGLSAQPAMNLSIEGWQQMLRKYGPLWVTTDEQPGAGFAIHARLMTGIHGGGEANDTFVDIVDPGNGSEYKEKFADFLGKYEEEPRDPKRALRIQIVHWPADAGYAMQKGSGAFDRYTASRSFLSAAQEAERDTTSAKLEWLDLTLTKGSDGADHLYYLTTGEPQHGHAKFNLKVTNNQDVPFQNTWLNIRLMRKHKNNTETMIPLEGQKDGEDYKKIKREGIIAAKSSSPIQLDLKPEILLKAYDSEQPQLRLEVEFHWGKQRIHTSKFPAQVEELHYYNKTALAFFLVSPMEFMFKSGKFDREISLNDEKYRGTFWKGIYGKEFSQSDQAPVNVQTSIKTTVSNAETGELSTMIAKTVTTSQQRTDTVENKVTEKLGFGIDKVINFGLEAEVKASTSVSWGKTNASAVSTSVRKARTFMESFEKTQTNISQIPAAPAGKRRSLYFYPIFNLHKIPVIHYKSPNQFGQAQVREEIKDFPILLFNRWEEKTVVTDAKKSSGMSAEAALKRGEKIPNQSEADTVGAATHQIKRGTEEFKALIRNGNADIVFKNEENTDADRMMTPRLNEKVNALAALVKSEWPELSLRITEAWDENNEHSGNSTHYEARGADMTASDKEGSKLGRLARLAVNAGFDWVFFEDSKHIHASVSKTPPTTDQQSWV